MCAGTSSSSLQVQWEPPEADNGSPVLAYHVQYSPDSHSRGMSWQSGPQTPNTYCQVCGIMGSHS